MRFSTVIWDLDGTLLNTIDDLRDCVNHVLAKFGYPLRTIPEMKMFVGSGIRVMLARAVPGGEENPQFEEMFACFTEYYSIHCQDKTAPYEGVNEVLATLRKNGCKMAIVTNKIQSAAEELCHNLFPEVEIVIGDSPDIQKKPAPDGVYKAMSLLGADPTATAYIGDSNIDVETAKAAGLPCLAVLWGFRTKEQLLSYGAEHLFDTPDALAAHILGE